MPARFYHPPNRWKENNLSEEEAKHASRVLRLKAGAEIELFDGEGQVCLAVISQIDKKTVSFTPQSTTAEPPPAVEIILYQAIPKGKNMDLIIQKAVELGVSAIYPIITKNTIAVSESPAKKQEKWQRIALEACKQCKQSWLPTVHLPQELHQLSSLQGELKLIASLRENARPMREVLPEGTSPSSVSLLIGPEGDFTDEEITLSEEAGCLPVSLGNLILRVETATLFGLSALRYQFG